MNEEEKIFKEVTLLWSMCPCKKFLGSATAKTIRKYLRFHKFNVSQENVYIQGILHEMDLLVLKKIVNNDKLIYGPDEILAVLEIKFRGSFGKKDITNLKGIYNQIKKTNKHISCLYVTLLENETYGYRITKSNTGFNNFELFFHKGSVPKGAIKRTGNWDRLLLYLSKVGK